MKKGFLLSRDAFNERELSAADDALMEEAEDETDPPQLNWGPRSLDCEWQPWPTQASHQNDLSPSSVMATNNANTEDSKLNAAPTPTTVTHVCLNLPNRPYRTGATPMAALNALFGARYKNRTSVIKFSDMYHVWDNGQKHFDQRFTCAFVSPVDGEIFWSGWWPGAMKATVPQKKASELVEDKTNKYPAEEQDVELSSEETSHSPLPLQLSSTIWMSTKKSAKNGAAARAYDCLQHRQRHVEYGIWKMDQAEALSQMTSTTVGDTNTPTAVLEPPPADRVGSEVPYMEDLAVFEVPPDWTNSYLRIMPPDVWERIQMQQQDVRRTSEDWGKTQAAKGREMQIEEAAWLSRPGDTYTCALR